MEISNTSTAAVKALAWGWAASELNRHQATIERVNNPVINMAWAAIQGGAETLAAVTDPVVLDVLHMAAAAIDTIPPHIIQHYKKPADELAAEIFQKTEKTAVLTIGVNEHFSGHYPPEWQAEKTCNDGARVTETNDGVTICKHTAKLWRPRQYDGLYIAACPHCQHNRAWRIAQQIEQEAGEYRQGQLGLRVLTVGKGGREKFANRATKHRQRHGEDVRYIAMPQTGGAAVIIHNMPEWGGEELPGTRPGLHALILDAVKNHDLKLNTSTSGGWGGCFAGTQGNSNKSTDETDQQPETAVRSEPGEPVKIHVKRWDKLALLVENAHQHNLKTRDKLKLNVVDFVAMLEAAGLEYGIVQGGERLRQLQESVRDSKHMGKTNKNLCIKSLTGEANSCPNQQTLPGLDPEKPQPIYLNGGWVS